MVVSMDRAWQPFVQDRANSFAGFVPSMALSAMGVPQAGSVDDALSRPGVYARDQSMANEVSTNPNPTLAEAC